MVTLNICGHPERKHRAKGRCASCYTKFWQSTNPLHNSGSRWLKNNPEKARILHRRAHLKKSYGITEADYEVMRTAQGGKCANVGCDFVATQGSNRLHVDHDHATGAVRGLLCKPCNTALGAVRDEVERLLGLVLYLRKR